jgi:hypothetical protein
MSRKNSRALPRIDPSQIKETTLDSETLAGIGRLILVCAEIEDLITEALFRAAKLHHVPGLMILGRSEIGSKLEKLQKILEVYQTDDFMDRFKRVREDIGAVSGVRNILAHGTFLGEFEEKLIFATTATITAGIPAVAEFKINGYPKKLIIDLANEKGPEILHGVQSFFGLPTPRAIQLSRLLPLDTTPPIPKKSNPTTTTPPPPEPSRG